MALTLIIFSSLLWLLSLALLFTRRQLLAPAASFIALTLLSMARTSTGYPVVPINSTILIGWLCMTVVVMLTVVLQPEAIRTQTKGMGYITGGAVAGMAVGLLGFTFSANLPLLYGGMIIATIAGTFFGFLLFSRTPDGRVVNLRSGNFFRYLLAKGFPTAITVMQAGVALVLVLAINNIYPR